MTITKHVKYIAEFNPRELTVSKNALLRAMYNPDETLIANQELWEELDSMWSCIAKAEAN